MIDEDEISALGLDDQLSIAAIAVSLLVIPFEIFE